MKQENVVEKRWGEKKRIERKKTDANIFEEKAHSNQAMHQGMFIVMVVLATSETKPNRGKNKRNQMKNKCNPKQNPKNVCCVCMC